MSDDQQRTIAVHPFASKHYRRPLHPNLTTDDNDLEAISFGRSDQTSRRGWLGKALETKENPLPPDNS